MVKVNMLNIGEWAVLLGDAAHSAIPPTGEGFNSGAEDVEVCMYVLFSSLLLSDLCWQTPTYHRRSWSRLCMLPLKLLSAHTLKGVYQMSMLYMTWPMTSISVILLQVRKKGGKHGLICQQKMRIRRDRVREKQKGFIIVTFIHLPIYLPTCLLRTRESRAIDDNDHDLHL